MVRLIADLKRRVDTALRENAEAATQLLNLSSVVPGHGAAPSPPRARAPANDPPDPEPWNRYIC